MGAIVNVKGGGGGALALPLPAAIAPIAACAALDGLLAKGLNTELRSDLSILLRVERL